MAKAVFDPGEVTKKPGEFKLHLVREYNPPVKEVEVQDLPEYTGPTVEELEQEAVAYREKWEAEKQKMLESAQASADEIVKKAEEAAFAEVKRQTDQSQVIKTDAEKTAAAIIADAQKRAAAIIDDAKLRQQELRETASKDGFAAGHETGYQSGTDEVNRLIERTHRILEAVMTRREQILNETEQQVVELVLLMTRKVIKILSENQKSVVMANVLQALRKVKGRGDVTVRVNLADVKLTSEHIQDFIHQVENVKNITILEDSTVEKGGCIVETDFGAIDARISSQLSELESKILEISPIKSVAKADVLNPEA
jgi:flagellar assembly protein FliH